MADGGADLEAKALARYRSVDYAGAVHLYGQAFAAYRHQGDALAAARVGRALRLDGNVHGAWGVVNGWNGRALAMLEGAGTDSADHGWTLVMQAPPRSTRGGDPLMTP